VWDGVLFEPDDRAFGGGAIQSITAKRDTMNCMSIMGAPIALLLVALTSHPAEAHQRKSHHHQTYHSYHSAHSNRLAYKRTPICTFTNDGRSVCGRASPMVPLDATGNRALAMADTGTIIGARPSGCPHAYCGCGLRKYLGLSDERLNLASNWARLLPREIGPRAGVAAVRSHHVMYIEGAAGDGQWLIRDYNSGGGLSRVRVGSVRGYIFVNPHAQIATR
jgi:hypothetical protein